VSFGFRHLTESLVVLAPGLALLLERTKLKYYRCLSALLCLLVLWNLILVSEYRHGWIPADAGGSPDALLAGALRILHRKWIELFVEILLVPVLAWILLRPEPKLGLAAKIPMVRN
jgi:uncharacterized membrane protein